LTSAGFKELRESEQWNIEPLGKVKDKKEKIIIYFCIFSFSILLLKMLHVLQHLLLEENIQMEMVLL